ncbi:MAG: AEC family transporter [Candidatus Limivicinus sp.]|nr:AEC family transporter [Candidatus Limivicinus sp.]
MDVSVLIPKMIVFVVLMVIGYLCAKTNFAGREFTKDASKMVINVFMTATIINSVLVSDACLSGGELLQVMLVLCMSVGVCWVLAAISCRLVGLGDKAPLFELLIAVMNNMFIALPVVETLFGSQAVFYCSLSCIPFNILLYTFGIYRLQGGEGKGSVRLRDIFSVPLLATLAALVIFLLQPPVPPVLKELASTMSAATMPLSMIVIGSSLGSVSLLDAFKKGKLYLMCVLRLLLCPLLVWLLAGLITDDLMLRVTATIIAAAPSGVVVSVLAIQYDRDAVFTSEGVLLSTVFSMLTIPLIVSVIL